MTLAHAAVDPTRIWSAWSFDPLVAGGLIVTGWLYARGVRALWKRAERRAVCGRQVAAFYLSLALVAVALLSPLDSLASSLVSGHMTQHLLLLIPAPILFAYAAPVLVLSTAMPSGVRRMLNRRARIRGFFGSVIVAVAAHSLAMWIWHLPGPYVAAVTSEWLHALEHASFLATALLFWSIIVQPRPRRRVAYPLGIVSAFVLWTLSGGLGALLTFSAQPLYPVLTHHAAAWDISALADQQLAGVIMWVPAGFAYLIAMAVLFVRWMSSLERRMRKATPAVEVPP